MYGSHLEVCDAVLQPGVLLGEAPLLPPGSLQLGGDGAALAQLLLQRALDDRDVLLDPRDVGRAELLACN